MTSIPKRVHESSRSSKKKIIVTTPKHTMASCFNWKEELPIVRPLLERSDMIEAQQRKKNEENNINSEPNNVLHIAF
jgi:hypothetical protein